MSAFYVVQTYELSPKRGLIANVPLQVTGYDQACRIAQRLAKVKSGVVAFLREGDPVTGEFENAAILYADGIFPEEVKDLDIAF